MQKEKFDRIVSFLLGALITFQLFLFLGYSLALFITITFVVVSLFLVLALDAFSINREKFYEIKKQTELLEKIYSKHTK